MEIGGADTDKCSHRTGYITGRHQLYVKQKASHWRGFLSDSMFYLLEAFCHFAYFGIDFCSEVFYLHCSLFATTLLAH